MLVVPTFVSKSEIEGLGLFAAESICKDELVWVFNPLFDKLIRIADLQEAPEAFLSYLERFAFQH
jgi:hypothetical protein